MVLVLFVVVLKGICLCGRGLGGLRGVGLGWFTTMFGLVYWFVCFDCLYCLLLCLWGYYFVLIFLFVVW